MAPRDFNLEEELKRNEFRISIFGSARIKPDDPIYQGTYNLAKEIAAMDMDLITGGGPGIMEAAACGHKDGDDKGIAHSIGLNIRLPFEQAPNEGLEMMHTHDRFSTRLDEFMLLSNVIVVMPGGIGTCLEFFYTWQLLQVKHLCHMPVILVGKMWRELINWVIDEPLKYGYLSPEDLDFIVLVDKAEDALGVIKKAKEHFDKEGPDACVNWKKYGN